MCVESFTDMFHTATEVMSILVSTLIVAKSENQFDIEKYKSQVKSKDADMLMIFPDDFKMGSEDTNSLSNIDIFYNSDKDSSMELYSKATVIFTAMQPRIFTFNESTDIEYDLVDKAAMLRNLLSGIIPLMVFMAVYMVCMTICIYIKK